MKSRIALHTGGMRYVHSNVHMLLSWQTRSAATNEHFDDEAIILTWYLQCKLPGCVLNESLLIILTGL